MRSISRVLVVAFTLTVLATTTPAANAAERTRDTRVRDRETRVVLVIKRLVKRFFGVATTGDQMTEPKPAIVVPGQG
jgi:hypothetical protein